MPNLYTGNRSLLIGTRTFDSPVAISRRIDENPNEPDSVWFFVAISLVNGQNPLTQIKGNFYIKGRLNWEKVAGFSFKGHVDYSGEPIGIGIPINRIEGKIIRIEIQTLVNLSIGYKIDIGTPNDVGVNI